MVQADIHRDEEDLRLEKHHLIPGSRRKNSRLSGDYTIVLRSIPYEAYVTTRRRSSSTSRYPHRVPRPVVRHLRDIVKLFRGVGNARTERDLFCTEGSCA